MERWAKSAADADHIFIADTGSTDKTISIAKRHKVNVASISIKPWRFDDARNAALSLLPADLDVVIALDLDEVLVPGWRKKLEDNWVDGCNRFRYKYVWNWHYGNPGLVYYGEKIAGRFTHRWKHPVHEILKPTVPEIIHFYHDVLIEHHADDSKSRGQYLPLLELAVEEDPADDRNAHYLAREYFSFRQYNDAIKEFVRHLDLPRAKWLAERCASMRYLGKCYEALNDHPEADYWFTMATFEDSTSREALIDAAKFNLARNNFHRTIDYCERAMLLPVDGGFYLNERYALNEGPYDLAGVAHFHLGNRLKGLELAKKAFELNPHDSRLGDNVKMMS